MFYVGSNSVELDELLFYDDFKSADLSENWEITGGEWISGDGVCTGLYRENAGGLIYTRRHFENERDIVLDFYGMIISPCNNDLNFSFRTSGWNYEVGDADVGYICGINGWYINRTGIERYPECKLFGWTESFRAESDREYHIEAGIVDGKCFIRIDGVMVTTLSDPNPIDRSDCDRVGLGTYCSHIRFRDFKVWRPKVTPVDMAYEATF